MHTNTWNRLRYTLMLPFYKVIVQDFEKDRLRSILQGQIQPHERMLILGCGPGLDLNYLPVGMPITAIDITPAMVQETQARARALGHTTADIRVMDGQRLDFPDQSFDVVILHLILAVIPDPIACIKETERVLKSGGRVLVFDKFLPDGTQPSFKRKVLNLLTSLAFSDINRRLEDILRPTRLQLISREKAKKLPQAGYVICLLRKE